MQIWDTLRPKGYRPVKGTQINSHFSVAYCFVCGSSRISHFSSKVLGTDYKAAQGYFYKALKYNLKLTLEKEENNIFKTFTSKKYRVVLRIIYVFITPAPHFCCLWWPQPLEYVRDSQGMAYEHHIFLW